MREAERTESEGGFVSISYVVAAAFAMLFFASLANLIVMQYASGVVRAALDEGVRDGAVAGAGAFQCQLTVDEFLSSVLGGPYGEDINAVCSEEPGLMVASATATFAGFAPLVPDLTFDFEAVAAKEEFVTPVIP